VNMGSEIHSTILSVDRVRPEGTWDGLLDGLKNCKNLDNMVECDFADSSFTGSSMEGVNPSMDSRKDRDIGLDRLISVTSLLARRNKRLSTS